MQCPAAWPPRAILKVTMPAIIVLLRDLRCGLCTVMSFSPRSTTDLACATPRIENEPRSALPLKVYADLGVLSHVCCSCSVSSRIVFLGFDFDFDFDFDEPISRSY